MTTAIDASTVRPIYDVLMERYSTRPFTAEMVFNDFGQHISLPLLDSCLSAMALMGFCNVFTSSDSVTKYVLRDRLLLPKDVFLNV